MACQTFLTTNLQIFLGIWNSRLVHSYCWVLMTDCFDVRWLKIRIYLALRAINVCSLSILSFKECIPWYCEKKDQKSWHGTAFTVDMTIVFSHMAAPAFTVVTFGMPHIFLRILLLIEPPWCLRFSMWCRLRELLDLILINLMMCLEWIGKCRLITSRKSKLA